MVNIEDSSRTLAKDLRHKIGKYHYQKHCVTRTTSLPPCYSQDPGRVGEQNSYANGSSSCSKNCPPHDSTCPPSNEWPSRQAPLLCACLNNNRLYRGSPFELLRDLSKVYDVMFI